MFNNPPVVWSNGRWERRDDSTIQGELIRYARAGREDPQVTASKDSVLIHGANWIYTVEDLAEFSDILSRALAAARKS